MKQKAFKIVLTCSLVGLGIVGCSNSSDPEITAAVLPDAPVNIPSISVQLRDNTGAALPAGISVAIVSEDDKLARALRARSENREASANREERAATTDEFGNIIIGLDDGVKDGQLSLTVNDSAYFPLTKIIDIGQDTNSTVLSLTKRPPADGVAVVQAGTDDAGNPVENVLTTVNKLVPEKNSSVDDIPAAGGGATVSVTGTVAEIKAAPDSAAEAVVAQVVIPDGITDAANNPIGEITVSAAVYQATTAESVSAFPGGLELNENALEDVAGDNAPTGTALPTAVLPVPEGIESEGFQTAGFVAIEVTDENNNPITDFKGDNPTGGKGLVITTLIPKTTINPDNNQLVNTTTNSEIPVWSYDSATGKWQYDGEAKIYADADDGKNWKAHFSATHLSYWNIDYRIRYCRSPLSISDVLTAGNADRAMIEFKDASGERDKRTLTVEMARKGGGFFLSKGVLGDGFIQSFRVPNFPVKLSIKDENGLPVNITGIGANGATPYDEVNGLNLCDNVIAGNDIYLEQPLLPVERTDVNFKVITSCSDSSLDTLQPPQNVPGALFYFYDNQALRFVNKSDAQGESTFTNLTSDSNYNIRVFARLGSTYGFRSVALNPARSAANPVIVDFEQECEVTTTTGSLGGT